MAEMNPGEMAMAAADKLREMVAFLAGFRQMLRDAEFSEETAEDMVIAQHAHMLDVMTHAAITYAERQMAEQATGISRLEAEFMARFAPDQGDSPS